MRHAWKFGAFALLLSAMTVVLVGCGGDDVKKPPASGTGAGTVAAAGFGNMPDWVPVFPDVKPQLIEDKKTDKGTSTTYSFTTTKTPAEVKEFYKKGFLAAGFKEADFKQDTIDDKEDGVNQENMKSDDGKRAWFINARVDKLQKETIVSLVYLTK